MTTHIQTLPAGRRHFSSRPLWAAIAVLGVVVLALGASLIHVQTRPVDGHSVLVTGDPFDAEPETTAAPLPVNTVAPDEAVLPARPAAATPDAAPVPPATPVAMPSTAAAPAPYVVTESGVVATGRPGQARAKVYSTD